ncbi:hypothetical protein NAPIS_ORF00066 [Vairimorpha apis BRL 01]|uniref:Uncharacterized protein n=1 Tax=Vairimorpha apis BRL 01 TaxID=1037528 RepID=T0MGW1_9MICR|nr:hypothetical protein NAPIS_ORF00066 [Vairimorpha apis BRL 01]
MFLLSEEVKIDKICEIEFMNQKPKIVCLLSDYVLIKMCVRDVSLIEGRTNLIFKMYKGWRNEKFRGIVVKGAIFKIEEHPSTRIIVRTAHNRFKSMAILPREYKHLVKEYMPITICLDWE